MLELLTSNIVAIQCFGALGYALFALSGFFKHRRHMFLAEGLGCSIVFVQWLLLASPAAAWIHIACVYAALSGLITERFPRAQCMTLFSIPLGACLIWMFGEGMPMDLVIFVAVLPGFCAKYVSDIFKLRVLSISGAFVWLVINVSLMSVPGILCSSGYLIGHSWSLLKELQLEKRFSIQRA